MTALLELKQKIKDLYGEYDTWIIPALKFLLALAVFLGINAKLGFLGKLDNIFVVLILSVICECYDSHWLCPDHRTLLCSRD